MQKQILTRFLKRVIHPVYIESPYLSLSSYALHHVSNPSKSEHSSCTFINHKFQRKVVLSNYRILQRRISSTRENRSSKEKSKVEETVKVLKEEAKEKNIKDSTLGAEDYSAGVTDATLSSSFPVVQPKPKRSIAKRIWDEIVHYYHGFRLLYIDIRVSSRLVLKLFRGLELSRRENKQLIRTVSDIFRLVPFSVFILVPFMELLLPVFLKFFPEMLPSTFQTASAKEKKFKAQLKLKIEMAKFLQETLGSMPLHAKGETHSHSAKEFAVFFEKIRTSGEQATIEEILKYSKLFQDELTLDNLPRPSLIALCKLLELEPIRINSVLRFQLRMRLRSLKADDKIKMAVCW